jgi:MoCo/4Fe-4S cofactor protein with predicted Tat translocation signal
MSRKHWRGLPQLNDSPEFREEQKNEFAEALPLEGLTDQKDAGSTRRDFLKVMGFSTAAVALAACETPVIRSIPYLVKPDEITPGVANFYASTFYDGHDFASILVKTREGRPIKIEGNDLNGLMHSGTNARVQASVLGLYDEARYRGPMLNGQQSTWANVDNAAGNALKNAKNTRILTSTIISPSTKTLISEFIAKYPATKHVTYDPVSYNALVKANKNVFGKEVVASYDFSKAKIVVGIACDFLGNWLSGEEFSKQYAFNRKVSKNNPEMSRHYHFESVLSMTGASADYRYMVKPSEIGKTVALLYNEVAGQTGGSKVSAEAKLSMEPASKAIAAVAAQLVANKGRSLVVCGLNDEGAQTLVNGINQMLGNYGSTVDVENHMNLKQGNDAEFAELCADMNGGKVDAILVYNCNPVYSSPASLKFSDAYKKVATRISFANVPDETALASTIVCPDNHYLESWGDANPRKGMYTLQQPAINPIFAQPRHEGTRQFQETLLKWSGNTMHYLAYLQQHWNKEIFPMQNAISDFPQFWSKALHDGAVIGMSAAAPVVKEETKKTKPAEPAAEQVAAPGADFGKAAQMATSHKGGNMELFVYEKVGLGNGNATNNPWLLEFPDPISRVTWDNYVTMNPVDVNKLGLNEMLRQDRDGSIVDLTVNGVTVKVPVYPSPGQAFGTIGLAVGYGRSSEALKVANGVGVNAFPFMEMVNGTIQPLVANADIKDTGDSHSFAATQIQHTIMAREEYLLREVSLPEFKANSKEFWNPAVELPVHGGGKKNVNDVDLWDQHPRPGHKWGMSIDLNLCYGCGACVIACTAENNVPVVGKLEVSRTRDMQWLRIDRYYTSDMTVSKGEKEGLGSRKTYLEMENPSANPQVTFQPMLCQHCNHAPCETVCPVLATTHSTEGLNMMTYNRCIGTRYCANNCPFKVRRFNWFNYIDNDRFSHINPSQHELGRMVLNPDVVVRGRGVMEKCTMCQQRLQAGKLDAKKAGKPLVDGAIKTACQAACSTGAISFGDLNDSESVMTKDRADERSYFLLEDVGVRPTTSYKVKVRNQDEPILAEQPVQKEDGQKEMSKEKHS